MSEILRRHFAMVALKRAENGKKIKAQSRPKTKAKSIQSLHRENTVLRRALWLSLDMTFDHTKPGALKDYWTRHSDAAAAKVAMEMIRANHPEALDSNPK